MSLTITNNELLVATLEVQKIDKTSKIKNLKDEIQVPVILAAEMNQEYAKYEFPDWIYEQATKDVLIVHKDYDELQKMIKNVNKIPINLNHSSFYVTESNEIGYVKDLWGDKTDRKIKGTACFHKKKLLKPLRDRILSGENIAVSIAGTSKYRIPEFDDSTYDLEQYDMTITHLALLPDLEGRCPAGTCGINLDFSYQTFHQKSLQDRIQYVLDSASTIDKPIFIDFTQPLEQGKTIFQKSVKKMKPISIQNDTSLNTSISTQTQVRDSKMGEDFSKIIDQMRQQLEQKDIELKSLRIDATKQFSDQLTEKTTQIETLNKSIQLKDSKIQTLETDLKKMQEFVSKIEEDEKNQLVSTLVDMKFDSKENLDAKCIKELRIIKDTLSKASIVDSAMLNRKNIAFPKGDESQRNIIKDLAKNTLGDAVADLSTLYKKEKVN